MSMNINEIRYFEQKMVDSACNDAIKYNPLLADRAEKARVMEMRGLVSFSEYITYLQDMTGNCALFYKYRF